MDSEQIFFKAIEEDYSELLKDVLKTVNYELTTQEAMKLLKECTSKM